MKISTAFAVLLLFLVGGYGQETTTVSETTTENTVPDTTIVVTTTLAPTTSEAPTSTVAPTSSTKPPTTQAPDTTEKPTTVAPTTPTVAPTTTPTVAPTTTPSVAPVTTPTVAPTTPPTVAPTTSSPLPDPTEGSWNLTVGNVTCVKLDMKARFTVNIGDSKEYINLSPNASISGTCSGANETEEVILTDSEYTLSIYLSKDSSSAFVSNVTLLYRLPQSFGIVYNDSHFFNVKIGSSYLCSSTVSLLMGNVTMDIYKIQIQGYGDKSTMDYGTVVECDADKKVSDIVPIAVGIALLALVVIVLIAYFVGRRRSRQLGYQSV